MTYNQFAATFGSDARLAAPADFKTSTPNIVQFYIDEALGNNVLLHKNKPYIIKVDSVAAETIPDFIVADNSTTGTLASEFDGNKIDGVAEGGKYLIRGISYSTDENSITTIDTVTFSHTSSTTWPMTQIAWHGAFVYPQTIAAGFYSFLLELTNGADAQMVQVSDPVTQFRGLRCWMTTDESASSSAKQVAMAVGDDIITGNTSTGFSEMKIVPTNNGNIYTLSGMLVRRNATNADGLSKGIYIWNNKKIEVK